MPLRIDGIERGRALGGEDAEDKPDGRRKDKGQQYG